MVLVLSLDRDHKGLNREPLGTIGAGKPPTHAEYRSIPWIRVSSLPKRELGPKK
jgi:hypothetical protein